MFRFLLVMVASIFVLGVVRMITTALSKGVSDMMSESGRAATDGGATDGGATGTPGARQTPPASAGPTGGALKRDPVCGTYIPVDNSVRKKVDGETLYFCSPECRDKYV